VNPPIARQDAAKGLFGRWSSFLPKQESRLLFKAFWTPASAGVTVDAGFSAPCRFYD